MYIPPEYSGGMIFLVIFLQYGILRKETEKKV